MDARLTRYTALPGCNDWCNASRNEDRLSWFGRKQDVNPAYGDQDTASNYVCSGEWGRDAALGPNRHLTEQMPDFPADVYQSPRCGCPVRIGSRRICLVYAVRVLPADSTGITSSVIVSRTFTEVNDNIANLYERDHLGPLPITLPA